MEDMQSKSYETEFYVCKERVSKIYEVMEWLSLSTFAVAKPSKEQA